MSPDGHWLAYASNESGRFEVNVRPFPGPGGKWPISTSGGAFPLWSHEGRELFFKGSGWPDHGGRLHFKRRFVCRRQATSVVRPKDRGPRL
ncbi:hypothetical protein SBA6_900013 [Candidatus Sulfopaludibacter sp. SbA6]|nr:hypothetical protein SBA6_900013 [Candidatus Sulfopaludibacter sp. SbA6]